MSRYRNWANGEVITPAPTQAATIPQPRIQIVSVPPIPTRVDLMRGVRHSSAFAADSIPATVQIVKVDSSGDPYENLLCSLTNLAPGHHAAVDATRMSGTVEFAEMAKWTSNARYYTGVSDATAEGRFDAGYRQMRDRELSGR